MNCPICSHPLEGRYCSNCGARVAADGSWAYRGDRGAPSPVDQQPQGQPSAASQAGPIQAEHGTAEPASRSSLEKRVALAAGALATLVILAIAGIVVLGHQTPGSTTAAKPTVVPAAKPTSVPPIRKDFGPLVAVPGSELAQLQGIRNSGPLSGSTPMEAEVALQVRSPHRLHTFIKSLYNPRSPKYHQFLSPAQFSSRYAPSKTDRRDVAGWLAGQGLAVTEQARNGLLIVARGTADQMNKAFGTTVDTYTDSQGFTFYANSTNVHVPQRLRHAVIDVDGLNNIGHVSGSARPRSIQRDNVSGFTPHDLRVAYNLTALYDKGLDGSNQTIALAEFGDVQQSDIDTYDQQFGLSTSRPERISVPFDGRQAKPGAGQEEVELDIEVLHAIAPKAHVLVYESPQTNGAGLAQANRVVSDDRASLVSVSWGFPDILASTGVLSAIDQVLAEGAAQGQTILVASGDAGAFDDPNLPSTPVVDYPSSDPWVTAVGGTSLYTGGSGYEHETVWSRTSDKTGSGGGLSGYFKRPWYQSGPGVINQYSIHGLRQSPDVAAVADPNTGYSVYVTQKGQSGWAEYGGTSAAAPLWAGYLALVQQKLGHNLGFLNPLLYKMGRQAGTLPKHPYHDVTEGDNLYYSATPGWDFGTGWGSMNGANMLQDIQKLESK